MTQEKKTLHLQWDPLTIVLGVAGVFAIGSVGFFLAVYVEGLGASSGVIQIHVNPNITTTEKQQLLAGLESTSTENGTASNSGALTSAQKLKLLRALSSP